jgi:Delta24-sterol reductase
MDNHSKLVTDIAHRIRQHVGSGSAKKLRFRHSSTNSTRSSNGEYEYINVGALNRVLRVDMDKKVVVVEPNVSMNTLVEETLKYDLIPEVVMEFPAITVGGGVQGAGLESSSFKYGQFNDTCVEYELITGSGDIIRASSQENPDLFYGISIGCSDMCYAPIDSGEKICPSDIYSLSGVRDAY